MANNLDLSVLLKLKDEISAPLKGVQGQLEQSNAKFKETKKALRELQRQQGDISSFKKLENSLGQTSDKLSQARMKLSDLQQKLKATSSPTKTLTNQFNRATAAVQKLEHKFDKESTSLQQVRSRLAAANISTKDLGRHQSRLANEVTQATAAFDKQAQKLNKLRNIQAQSDKMKGMRNDSAMLAAKGAAATYAASQFVMPGVELDKNLSKVQAVTRLDKNSPQYKALVEQAKKLGATTQFTAADAAAGQSFLGMAGFTPEAIKAAMPGMLDLALAGNMELPRVADIASNILSGMKLDPTKDMGKVGDVLSAAFTRANLNVEMLGETMKYAAPGAAGLGISLEEVAAMAGKLGDAGIQGSMGGTALRSIMSRMAAPTKAAHNAFQDLNIATTDAQGNLRKMPDILTELYNKTKDLGNAKQLEYFKAIGGEEAGNALQVLVDQAGSGELQQLVGTLSDANGEASKLAKTMSDNVSGDGMALSSATDALRTSVFDANKDAIRGLMQTMTALILTTTEWANAHPELVAMAGKLFAILAGGAMVLGGVGATMLTVLAPMAMLRASLTTLGLPTTLTPIGMLIKSIKMIGTAIKLVGMAAMSNPLLAIIGLLAIAAIYIWANWDTLGPKFAALWDSICAGASALWQWLVGIWNGIWQGIINIANQLWAGLGIKFNSGIAALIAIIVAFSPVGLFIRAFAAVWTWMSGLGEKFRSYGVNMIQGLINGITSKIKAIKGTISSVTGAIKGVFTSKRGVDIHSPSRVFRGYGDYIMQGLSQGLTGNNSPIRNMLATSNSLRQAMDTSEIRFDKRKPITAGLGQSQSTGMASIMAGANITINVYTQPNQSAKDVGNEIGRKLQELMQPNTALYDQAEDWA